MKNCQYIEEHFKSIKYLKSLHPVLLFFFNLFFLLFKNLKYILSISVNEGKISTMISFVLNKIPLKIISSSQENWLLWLLYYHVCIMYVKLLKKMDFILYLLKHIYTVMAPYDTYLTEYITNVHKNMPLKTSPHILKI